MRTARVPLTAAQRDLVAGHLNLVFWLANRAPSWLRRTLGADVVEQECFLAACRAAAKHDPDRSGAASFETFLTKGVRLHLRGLVTARLRNASVWCRVPQWATDDGTLLDAVADHRRPSERDPALALWCSDGCRLLRRGLNWRHRVILYMRTVERWSLQELADFFGVTREAIRVAEERAVARVERLKRGRSFS